ENKYLKPEILIEFGGRNVIDPNEKHYIEPDVAAITQGVIYPKTEAIILSPVRTFWEKATLIHVECNRNTFKQNSERLSRHWYDLAKLAAHSWGKLALNDRDLLADVVQHKKAFFNTSYANYDACLIGKFQLIPDELSVYELYKDYQQMVGAGMIYEEMDFGEIFDSIFEIEELINASSL
ncbi:MAG: nucleotidyl transferase AbiEii/AbiGii toxin family protein, partial [Legionellales bacterium]